MKNKKTNKISVGKAKVLFILILTISAVGVFYISITRSQKLITDRQRFVVLSAITPTIRDRLQAVSSQGVVWQMDQGSCGYTYGTGLRPGGWYCGSSLTADIKSNTPTLVSDITRFDETLRASSDILIFKSTNSYKNFPQKIEEGGGFTSLFTTVKGGVGCQLTFTVPRTSNTEYVNGALICGDGAQKSWLPNHETDSSIPGRYAWRS